MTKDYTFEDESQKISYIKQFQGDKALQTSTGYFGRIPTGPSASVISNILAYSRALSVVKTYRSGNFNMLLN